MLCFYVTKRGVQVQGPRSIRSMINESCPWQNVTVAFSSTFVTVFFISQHRERFGFRVFKGSNSSLYQLLFFVWGSKGFLECVSCRFLIKGQCIQNKNLSWTPFILALSFGAFFLCACDFQNLKVLLFQVQCSAGFSLAKNLQPTSPQRCSSTVSFQSCQDTRHKFSIAANEAVFPKPSLRAHHENKMLIQKGRVVNNAGFPLKGLGNLGKEASFVQSQVFRHLNQTWSLWAKISDRFAAVLYIHEQTFSMSLALRLYNLEGPRKGWTREIKGAESPYHIKGMPPSIKEFFNDNPFRRAAFWKAFSCHEDSL